MKKWFFRLVNALAILLIALSVLVLVNVVLTPAAVSYTHLRAHET